MLDMKRPILAALLLSFFGCAVSGGAPDKNGIPAKTADRVVIQKSAYTLTLMSGDRVLKSYRVALGLKAQQLLVSAGRR
ncbi:MAG: L,D-transpeptidase [Acidobacteriia bacterium]|nr:L,D-transpeptidase [Terriglobia bacterium]